MTAAANSYFGLLRQSPHSHADRARLANAVRRRGHWISGDLTKTFRKSNSQFTGAAGAASDPSSLPVPRRR